MSTYRKIVVLPEKYGDRNFETATAIKTVEIDPPTVSMTFQSMTDPWPDARAIVLPRVKFANV